MFNTIGFNNFYMNNFMPAFGMNPFMGGCYNSFNPMFQFGMMNSLFGMPQMFSFPSFSMPMFSPFSMPNSIMPSLPMSGNIFSMTNSAMYTPAFNPMMNFSMPSLFGQMNLLNQYGNMFGTLLGTKLGEASNADNVKVVDVDNSPVKDTGKLDKHFLKRVKQVAKKVNCNYKDLLAVMNSESSLNPKCGNGNSAVGLIQFTKVAIDALNRNYGLNLTRDKILKMSPVEQLDIVEKCLLMNKKQAFGNTNKKMTAADLYAIVFLPGRANNEVLCTKGERKSNGKLLNFYEKNSGLDKNKDNKITKTDLAQHLAAKRVNESIFA